MPQLKTHHLEILTRTREAAGLSQAELARRAKCTQAAVNRVEAGKLVPSADLLERICGALGLACKVVPAKVTIQRKGG